MRTFNAELITLAPVPDAFPPPGPPEIAVVGRSNAGKSTLINTLMGQRHLARVSGNPGKTRAIVFFDVERRFVLADLPGYGFAKAPKHEQASWRGLVGAYLAAQRPLAGVIALFDIRREIGELDRTLVAMLSQHGLEWRAVWTKADKLKRAQLGRAARGLDGALGLRRSGIPFSSKTRLGRDALLEWIEERIS